LQVLYEPAIGGRTIRMSIELPAEIQPAVDEALQPLSGTDYSGANRGPVIPATNMPLPPNMAQNNQAAQSTPTPPEIAPPNGTGSLADKISRAFLEHLAQNQPQPVQSKQPQQHQPSTGQNIVGAAQGVMTALGDASHANDHPGGGWLGGVVNTLNARNNRLSAEAQQQFQNGEEKRKNDALIARNQAETVALQRNIYRQDSELRQTSYKQGSAFTDSMRAKHDVQDGISQNELTALVKDNSNYLQTHYAKQTSEEAVYDGDGKPMVDSQGNPVMSPIYSLITRATRNGSPNTHTITQEDHDFILKNTGQDIPVNTQYPFDSWMSTSTSALANHNTISMVNKSRVEDMTAEQQRQVQSELADPSVQHAIAAVPGRPLGGLYQFQQNADQHLNAINIQMGKAQQTGDQAAIQQLQQQTQHIQEERAKIAHVIDFGFSTADKEKYNDEVEREKHDRAEEAEKLRAERDRNEGKAKQKLYDQAHDVWNDAKAKNNQDDDEAAAYLLRTNPKALATLQDEENRNAIVTEREDPLTGTTTRTTKGKSNTFTDLINNNRQAAAAVTHLDTVNDATQRWQQIMSSTQLSNPMKIRLLKHYNYSVPPELTNPPSAVRLTAR
jgi:hypothetical protein